MQHGNGLNVAKKFRMQNMMKELKIAEANSIADKKLDEARCEGRKGSVVSKNGNKEISGKGAEFRQQKSFSRVKKLADF